MRPGFSRISQLQERALHDQLVAARELISHPSEKGRSLEREVSAVLRELLPSEYGIGTGFIVSHGSNGPQLSSQLDIIIFDSIRGGPLGRLAACEVYPIEIVYGYVEVKASLCLAGDNAKKLPYNSIQKCMEQNHALRQLRERRFWDTSYGGSPIQTAQISINNWLAVRAFVFAFEADGEAAKNPQRLAQDMSNSAHLHGVLVLDQSYFTTIPIEPNTADQDDYHHVFYTTQHPFTAFKLHLLKALGTFQRPPDYWIPALDNYFDLPNDWNEVRPNVYS
ncbi:MAG TPA: DUF6602 domain-containing protein [Gammaproteobacteria bacterium]